MGNNNLELPWSSVMTSNNLQNQIHQRPPTISHRRLELKPTTFNYGRILASPYLNYEMASSPYLKDPVPWSYGREDVPKFLENYGVSLQSWQEWIDRASELWMERNESSQQFLQVRNFFAFLANVFPLNFIMIIYLDYAPYVILRDILFVLVMVISLFLCYRICCMDGTNSRIEKKWKDLIHNINSSIGKNQGISARPCYCIDIDDQDTNQYASWLYTVGVTFDMEMKDGIVSLDPVDKNLPMQQHQGTCFDSMQQIEIMPPTSEDINWRLELKPIEVEFSTTARLRCIRQHKSCTHDMTAPWSYGREEIPAELSSHGVTLTIWQEWVDRATTLWRERIQQKIINSTMDNSLRRLFVLYILFFVLAPNWIPWNSYSFLMGYVTIISIGYGFGRMLILWRDYEQQSEFLSNEKSGQIS